MLDPFTMFREGGPWMYPLLLLGLGLPVVWIAMALASLFRIRVPAVIWIGAGLVPLLVGMFGTVMGTRIVLSALEHASPEIQAPMAANGLSSALYTVSFSALLTSVAYTGMALTQGLATLATSGGTEDAPTSWTPLHAAGAALVLFASGLSIIQGVLWVGLVGLGIAIALATVAVRLPSGERAAKAAADRVLVATLGLLAVAGATVTSMLTQAIMYYNTRAQASIEVQDLVTASVAEGLEALQLGGALVATAVGLAGLLAAIAAIRHLLSLRTIAGAGISVVLLSLMVVPSYSLVTRVLQIHEIITPFALVRAPRIEASGLQLPHTEAVPGGQLLPSPVLQLSPRGTTLDDQPIASGPLELAEGPVLIEADASLPLSVVAAHGAALHHRPLRWVVQTPEGLRALNLGLDDGSRPDPAPPQGRMSKSKAGSRKIDDTRPAAWVPPALGLVSRGEDGWDLLGLEHGAVLLGHLQHDTLVRGLRDALDQHPDADVLYVWMPEQASVQELISIWDQLPHTDPEPALIWRTDSAPEPGTPPGHEAPPSQEPLIGLAPARDAHVDKPITVGTLDRSLIAEVIKRHLSQIQYCYQRELVKEPGLKGKIVIKFTVTSDGTVDSASLEDSTMDNVSVEQCIVRQFMRMQFPEPRGGGIVIVSYPFLFSPE
ncbi:MAG TPA: AgmX/PglI C-terminal domain-containing protein [Deltaproteobacteria bacterium]|nr:AgmX/PglI C-terminal domain-containing protein [Deltaproteobacteria bacterium]